MRREAVIPMPGPKMLCQVGEQVHIFREAGRDIWFQNLEDTALAGFDGGIPPGETNDRADARFAENSGFELDGVPLELRPELPLNGVAYLVLRYVIDSIFEFDESAAQRLWEVAIPRQHLAQLLQARHLDDQFEQAHFGWRVERQFHLLDQLGCKPRGREPREHKSHGFLNQRPPVLVQLRHKFFDGEELQHPRSHFIAELLPLWTFERCLDDPNALSRTPRRHESRHDGVQYRCGPWEFDIGCTRHLLTHPSPTISRTAPPRVSSFSTSGSGRFLRDRVNVAFARLLFATSKVPLQFVF